MQDQDAVLPDAGAERLVAGRYRLLSVLGAGGMGRVWRARDEVLQREVAVKEVRAPAELPPERVELMYARLEREAWAAARISTTSVVTVHDVATFDERPWIVMELIRGRSLADEIGSRGSLPPGEAARIGARVLEALRAAHAAGVLHRDVKPGNVLLADEGRVVLTDFGIATVEGDTALTMTGEVIGSPEYLAPERALGRTPGPASDLWSLGALLYAAVAGRSPFRRTSALATLRAVVDDPLPPLDAGPLTPVLEGLMRKDPADRLTAEQAAELLRLTGEGNGQEATPAGGKDAKTATPGPDPDGTTAVQPTDTSPSTVPDRSVDPRIMVAAGVPSRRERSGVAGAATAEAGNSTATARVDAPPTPDGTSRTAAETPAVAADPRPPAVAHGAGDPDTPAAPTVSAAPARDSARPPTAMNRQPAPASPAQPMPAVTPPQSATAPAQAVPPRRPRRTGFLVAAAALALALVAGGVYVLVDRTGAGGEEKASGSGSAGRASAGASEAADDTQDGAQDDADRNPVSVTLTGHSTTYIGACPMEDMYSTWFTATFTASELPVQFSYRWVSSNGHLGDSEWQPLALREGNPRTVRVSLPLSARLTTYAPIGETLRSEMTIEIRSPFEAKSNSVPFAVTCVEAR